MKNDYSTRTYDIDIDIPILVKEGDTVAFGDCLTEGNVDLKKLLEVAGLERVREYMVEQILEVY